MQLSEDSSSDVDRLGNAFLRMLKLECELSVAAVLLELREKQAAERGEPRSAIVSELMDKWRKLLKEKI